MYKRIGWWKQQLAVSKYFVNPLGFCWQIPYNSFVLDPHSIISKKRIFLQDLASELLENLEDIFSQHSMEFHIFNHTPLHYPLWKG